METVLITGASSGIGVALADCFAADDARLVLVARRNERLQVVADDLRRKFDVEVHVCAVDLADPAGVRELCQALEQRHLNVDVLVNNAGFGILGPFQESDRQLQLKMVALNVAALTDLTHRLLPQMLARRRGGILNVSSVAAYPPGPWMAVYYATKAYVQSFSDALWYELKATGIQVTTLSPGPVKTEFASRSGVGSLGLLDRNAMSAPQVAQAGYRAYRAGRRTTTPGWGNWAGTILSRCLPRALIAPLVGRIQMRKRTGPNRKPD